MENDIKISELFWMPWVWKSTYCNDNFASNEDFSLINDYNYLNKKKLFRYINYLKVLFNKKYIKLNYYFLKLILINKSSNKLQDFKEIFSYLKILSIYDIFIKNNLTNDKKLVLDQWFIQLLFSSLNNTLIFEEKYKYKKIIKIEKTIEKFLKSLNLIWVKMELSYLYTSKIENNIERLNKRKTNYSRFDKIKKNKKELEEKIDLWNKIFNLINNQIENNKFNNLEYKKILN